MKPLVLKCLEELKDLLLASSLYTSIVPLCDQSGQNFATHIEPRSLQLFHILNQHGCYLPRAPSQLSPASEYAF